MKEQKQDDSTYQFSEVITPTKKGSLFHGLDLKEASCLWLAVIRSQRDMSRMFTISQPGISKIVKRAETKASPELLKLLVLLAQILGKKD